MAWDQHRVPCWRGAPPYQPRPAPVQVASPHNFPVNTTAAAWATDLTTKMFSDVHFFSNSTLPQNPPAAPEQLYSSAPSVDVHSYLGHLARLLALCAVFGFPFVVPYVYKYFALPRDLEEIRNEDMDDYDENEFYNYMQNKYRSV